MWCAMKEKSHKSFFENLPAILGGVAAVITAISGLVIATSSSGASHQPLSPPIFSDVSKLEPNSSSIPSGSSVSFKEIHGGESYWAKEGYYLNVDNYLLRLWPSDIRNSSIVLKVTDKKNKILVAKTLRLNENIIFLYNGTTYKFILSNIGRAGKNPFNKAAFFLVKKHS